MRARLLPLPVAALLAEWDTHPDYDDYWRAEDCSLHFDRMDVPCFTLGSWYDFMVQGSIESFIGRQHLGGPHSRGQQQLVVGPWLHGRLNKQNAVGDLVYPENAAWPEREHLVRWCNHWLKGEDTGIMNEPAVRYYVMGAVGEPGAPGNTWREAPDWPPAARETRLYLHEHGKLTPDAPTQAEQRTTYVSDPRHPMVHAGASFPGARDARHFERQPEVRTWTSEVLAAPVEWTGAVHAEIWLSSTAPDTDVILRVSDVYPDGRSLLVMDYPLRARYREGFDRQVLLTPDEPALLRWRIGWTSLIFNRGHRIRVTIASTAAPLHEPNNQTGGPQTVDWMRETRIARNSIWHDAARPSCLVVPMRTMP